VKISGSSLPDVARIGAHSPLARFLYQHTGQASHIVMSSHSSTVRLSALPIPGLVYRSLVMCQIAHQIRRAAQSRATVLITGETGTGKELVAHAVHSFSGRAHKRFSPINATALHPSLAEASLFGHKEGAFTDARSSALGTIRAAV
jgi:DNA-binding NtrC family response regulator